MSNGLTNALPTDSSRLWCDAASLIHYAVPEYITPSPLFLAHSTSQTQGKTCTFPVSEASRPMTRRHKRTDQNLHVHNRKNFKTNTIFSVKRKNFSVLHVVPLNICKICFPTNKDKRTTSISSKYFVLKAFPVDYLTVLFLWCTFKNTTFSDASHLLRLCNVRQEMNDWVWDVGGMILTGDCSSTRREMSQADCIQHKDQIHWPSTI